MRLFLAPMEGVIDAYMRHSLTSLGGYSHCVTEFVRVVDRALPARVFYRLCPELHQGGMTRSGVPVIVQLLGADPQAMAENAQRAVELGAPGIDINFGCPSKTVNKRQGGAVLLKTPQRLEAIVTAVRRAVDGAVPVSAKIRLGYADTELALDNAHAVEAGGADFITVHARTRADGYRAPARWEWLALIAEALSIPVVANGDINSVDDYRRCCEISGCEDVMIGRGAVARPDLARQIALYQAGDEIEALTWTDVRELVWHLSQAMGEGVEEKRIAPRIKQWLSHLRRQYDEAGACFEALRTRNQYADIRPSLMLEAQS